VNLPATLLERLARWFHVKQVRCAAGHHVPQRLIPLPAGGIQCEHRDHAGARHCGRWLYVVACNAAGIAFVVPTTYARIDEIRTRDLAPLDALHFLGVDDLALTITAAAGVSAGNSVEQAPCVATAGTPAGAIVAVPHPPSGALTPA
jgi:hypothetical protein